MPQHTARGFRIENHGNPLGPYLSSPQAPERPLRGDSSDRLRVLQFMPFPRDRIPVVPLHALVVGAFGHGCHGQGKPRTPVVPQEPVRVGQHHRAIARTALRPLRIGHAGVGLHGRPFRALRHVNGLIHGHGGGIIQVQIGNVGRHGRLFGQSRRFIFSHRLCKGTGIGHQLLERGFGKIRGGRARGPFPEKHPNPQALFPRLAQAIHGLQPDLNRHGIPFRHQHVGFRGAMGFDPVDQVGGKRLQNFRGFMHGDRYWELGSRTAR